MPESIEARLLELIGEVQGLLDLQELHDGLIVALNRAVPSDWVGVHLMRPEPAEIQITVWPPLSAEQLGVFTRLAHENPLVARYERTRDSRPHRFSDVMSTEELHGLALYREFYAPLGIEFQVAFIVAATAESYVGIAMCRRDRDYTVRECELLDRARPHLIQVYRNALAHDALQAEHRAHATGEALVAPLIARGLTARPAAVLSRVAHGQSNAEIALALGISERTVGKHLQNCYRQLGVRGRSEAAGSAWELSQLSAP